MQTVDFLVSLYGEDAPGHIVLWTRQDKKTKWYESKNLEAVAKAARSLARDKDVYFGISPQDREAAFTKGGKDTRGFMDTSLACPGLWLDLDIQGEAHKSDKLPPTLEAAVSLIRTFPLEPSILVHSGHGLQAWWLFKELWIFDSPQERKEAQDLVHRFQMTMKSKAETHKWEIDSTFDLARVLRLPGTFNRKLSPEPVRVLNETSSRYNPHDFEDYLIDAAYIRGNNGKKVDPVSVLAGVPQGQRDTTLFKYACRLRAKGMTQEEAEALVLRAAVNCTPPFPVAEAREKVSSAWKYEGGSMSDQILDCLADRPEDVFNPETLAALADLYKTRPGNYSQIKQQLKGKVNLNDMERAVRDQVKKNAPLRLVDAAEPLPLLEDLLPEWPLKNMRKPWNWSINENGVWRQDPKQGDICACPVPVTLKQRLKNAESGEEKIELAYYRDGRWHYISAKRSVVFNRNSLVMLSDKGLLVSSETSKELVRYFMDVERENLTIIPVTKSVDHMGWIGTKQFLPGAAPGTLLDLEEGGSLAVAYGYKPNGTLAQWLAMVEPLRQYPIARFTLGAAFAAPLLRLLAGRVFFVHNYGKSRGGKTAALKVALSVYGCPDDLMVTFNATKVGLERVAAFYQDLPLGIDERQVIGDRQGIIESLVYMLGTGKGKVRGAKKGGLQEFSHWKTIIMTTGEEPLSVSSSAAGIKTRAVELYGEPIPNEELAAAVHRQTSEFYGTAGPEFIIRLIRELQDNPDMIRDLFNDVETKLKEWHNDKIASHRSAVATVAAADFLVSLWLFGLSEIDARDQAMAMAEAIFEQLDTAKEAEDSTRAHDYLMGWYGMNVLRFGANPPSGTRYGMAIDDYAYIFPPAYDAAMKEGGFSPDRILKDWAEQGKIKTETRDNKLRFKIRKYDPVTGKQVYFVAVKLPEEQEGIPF